MKTLIEEFGKSLVTFKNGSSGVIRSLPMTTKQLDGDQPIVSFVASSNCVDRYNEVIDQKAWGDFANFRRNPVITDCHNYSSVGFILGRATRFEVKAGLLENDVLFATSNPLGKIGYDLARQGFCPTQSVGFIPIEWQNGMGKEPDRTYTKCDLLEIALTVVPANPDASNIKKAFSAGALELSDLRELALWLTHFCSEDKPGTSGPRSASAGDALDAHALLRMARGLDEVLKRA